MMPSTQPLDASPAPNSRLTNTHSPEAYPHPRDGDKTDVGPINKIPIITTTNLDSFFQHPTSAYNETDAVLTNMTPDYAVFTPFTKPYGTCLNDDNVNPTLRHTNPFGMHDDGAYDQNITRPERCASSRSPSQSVCQSQKH